SSAADSSWPSGRAPPAPTPTRPLRARGPQQSRGSGWWPADPPAPCQPPPRVSCQSARWPSPRSCGSGTACPGSNLNEPNERKEPAMNVTLGGVLVGALLYWGAQHFLGIGLSGKGKTG